MDLNLKALIGVYYLVPIAITLRKLYAPDFDMPDAFKRALVKIDTSKTNVRFVTRFSGVPAQPPQASLI